LGPKITSQVAGVKPDDLVKISTDTLPQMSGCRTAIGGGPALVHGGTPLTFGGLQTRHPRSAIGWNKDYFFLVEVDGRQKTSAGMSFPELAAYMAKLGCEEANNLDGGGSATLWVRGNVMNSPSEGRERPAANALVVVRKDPHD
jgi:exopolysaccharide biosynthesis protein